MAKGRYRQEFMLSLETEATSMDEAIVRFAVAVQDVEFVARQHGMDLQQRIGGHRDNPEYAVEEVEPALD